MLPVICYYLYSKLEISRRRQRPYTWYGSATVMCSAAIVLREECKSVIIEIRST